MRARMILGWLVLLTMVAAIGYAQTPPAPAPPAPAAAAAPHARPAVQLSLAEALDVARQNNPDYLSYLSARSPAVWSLRNSTLDLFTPTARVTGAYQYQAAANGQIIQGFPIPATPSYHASNLSFGLGYQLSGTSITNRGYASASLAAADQDIVGAATVLETSVKTEYINLLEARAQADLAQHVIARAQELLNLAQAQFTVGQKTIIDVKQAQVVKGNADVALLQAQQNVQIEVLRLYNLMGVPAPEPPDVVPTDTFAVVQPAYNQDSLVSLALDGNPTLRAYRAREGAARWNVRGAYSQYLPSLQASAGTGRSWITQGTTSYAQTNPWFIQVGVSLPIYDALSRNVAIAQASAADEGLRLSVRKTELALRANVSAAYLALMTAYQTIGVQANNRAAADDALSLAEEQYRVGSGSIIQLNDAQVASEQAGVSYINAVYDYHKAVAALELAVGRPLR
jgi:outer membrane protein